MAAAGVCDACTHGDHGHHRPGLGHICVGCACPWTPAEDDDGEAAVREWAEAHGYELVDVRPVGTRTARQAFALGEHR